MNLRFWKLSAATKMALERVTRANADLGDKLAKASAGWAEDQHRLIQLNAELDQERQWHKNSDSERVRLREEATKSYEAHRATVAELEQARANLDLMRAANERLKARLEVESAAAKDWELRFTAGGVVRGIEANLVTGRELRAALAGVTETTPWWRGVHALLTDQTRIEIGAVCEPGIGDELAHVRRGRLAAIQDFQAGLLDHAAKAQKGENETRD